MMNFAKMRVATRLGLGFGLLIVSLVVVSTVAWVRLTALTEKINDLVENRMVKVRLLTEFKENLNTVARVTRNVVLIIDVNDAAAEAEKIAPLRARNSEILEQLSRTV